ncbi:MAG TPA: DHHA1 domain-containing protein [Gemmatimonadaceae bacterium]|nr:DHHA1 domain-containing protein [Gemmatimonadaceae bacterium]
MTDRLYYTDSRLSSFEARIVALDADRRVITLDRSAFYPTSGGQPHDLGTLAGVPVVDVTEADDDVQHHLAAPLSLAVGDVVTGEIDAARRFDHMQQHSGQHLLSAVLEDQFGWPTVSVHIGADGCALDLRADVVAPEALRDAEQLVNAYVTENRPVHVSFEDAAVATGLRKPSERDGTLRIVTIHGLDRNACGGTHVSQTGEIGPILLRRTERTRGTVRVEFRCGQRAVRRARADMEQLLAACHALTTGVDELPALVASLADDRRTLEKANAQLTEQLQAHEARAVYAALDVDARGRRRRQETLADAPVKTRQAFAQQFAALDGAVFLAVSTQTPAVLLAAAPETGLGCGDLVRAALQAVGGRGGGTPRLAQGSAPTPEAALAARDAILAQLD